MTIPAGFSAGYIAVEIQPGNDISYWVLDQAQMDEVEVEYQKSNDYCEAMGEVIDRHSLYSTGADCSSIKECLEYMIQHKMILVEDFYYSSY